jgi:NTP pyrophosphatase (non-canonical NTP hydrolase)
MSEKRSDLYAPAREASDDKTPISELKERVEAFVQERHWQQFHSPKNLSMALSVEAGELMEIFTWMTEDESRRLPREKLHAAAEELADVLILCFNLASVLGVDAASAVWDKLEKAKLKYPADQYRGRYE